MIRPITCYLAKTDALITRQVFTLSGIGDNTCYTQIEYDCNRADYCHFAWQKTCPCRRLNQERNRYNHNEQVK